MHEFLAQLVNGVSLGGIYALIAIGYTMVYGIVELINFAHGDIYTLGSFIALAVFRRARRLRRTARNRADRRQPASHCSRRRYRAA